MQIWHTSRNFVRSSHLYLSAHIFILIELQSWLDLWGVLVWFGVFCGGLGSAVEVDFLFGFWVLCVGFFFFSIFPFFFFSFSPSSVFIFLHATALPSWFLNAAGFQGQTGKTICVVLSEHKWDREKRPSSPEYPSGFCPRFPQLLISLSSSRRFLFSGGRGGFPRRRPLEAAPGPALESSVAGARRPPPDTRPSPAPRGGRSSSWQALPAGHGTYKAQLCVGESRGYFPPSKRERNSIQLTRGKRETPVDSKRHTLQESECVSSGGVLGHIQVVLLMCVFATCPAVLESSCGWSHLGYSDVQLAFICHPTLWVLQISVLKWGFSFILQ